MTDKEDYEVGEDFDIEVVDTTPEEDRGKDLLPDEAENEGEPSEDELASYSANVRKRIERLTFEKHDQRRKREAAEREAQKAAEFAQHAMRRLKEYESALGQYEQFGVDQAKSRLETEISQVKAAIKQAVDQGDGDALAEAQEKLARLAPQHEQYSRYVPRGPEPATEAAPYYPQQQQQAPDEHFVGFISRNPWFNADEEMTTYALGIDMRYRAERPDLVGSPEYYADIESRVKKRFSGSGKAQAPRTTSVAPPSSGVPRGTTGKASRKSVTLTSDEMRLINRLGITPQQYAAEKLKEI